MAPPASPPALTAASKRYLIAALVGAGTYAVLPEGASARPFVFGASGLGIVVVLVVGRVRNRSGLSLGWRTVAAALVVGVIAHALTSVFAPASSALGSALSLNRLVFVPVNLFLAAALLLLVRDEAGKLDRPAAADAALVTLALGALSWVTLVQPTLARLGSLPPASRIVVSVYPLLDLVLAGAVCLLVAGPRGRRPSVALLCIGVTVQIVANSADVLRATSGLLAHRSPVGAGFLTLGALVAVALLRADEQAENAESAPADQALQSATSASGSGLLTGIATLNSVTIVFALLHEPQFSALPVAVVAGIIATLSAARLWQIRRANDALVSSAEAKRAELEHVLGLQAGAQVEASEGLRAQSDFLIGMTHRIGGPLNALLQATDGLVDADLPDEQNALVKTLVDSGDALLAMINDLLGVAEAGVGPDALGDDELDVRSVTAAVAEAFSDAVHPGRVVIRLAVDEAIPPRLRGDGARLGVILSCLVSNAVRCTSSGRVLIGASLVERREDGRALVRFGVHDTGFGLSAERQAVVFDREAPADSSERRYRGAPKGLARVTSLVELMGGEYGVESQPGKGASFWFTVVLGVIEPELVPPEPVPPEPVDAVAGGAEAKPVFVVEAEPQPEAQVEPGGLPEPGPEPEPSPTPQPEPTPSPETTVSPVPPGDAVEPPKGIRPAKLVQRGLVLLAEDDPLNRRVTLAVLKRIGYRVDVVTNGVDAMRAVAERRYDAVLMDCEMPRMSGLEATVEIRSHEGADRHTPIIALTAGNRDEDRDQAFDAGMDDFLAKPVLNEDLLSTLERWVSRQPVKVGDVEG